MPANGTAVVAGFVTGATIRPTVLFVSMPAGESLEQASIAQYLQSRVRLV